MKPETLREEFESLVEQCGYEIRKERGAFRGSHCIIEGDKIVMINKSRPITSASMELIISFLSYFFD